MDGQQMRSPWCREEARTASNSNEVDLELIGCLEAGKTGKKQLTTGFSSFYRLNAQFLQLILAECLRFEVAQLLLEAHVDLFLLC